MRRARVLAVVPAWLATLMPLSAEPIDILPLPAGAVATDRRVEDPGSTLIAEAPWKDGTVPGISAEGRISIGSWRVPIGGETTLALLTPYRQALAEAGFTMMLDCATDACGGFDFRFAITVLPEPAMHVDLGDFRYLSARRDSPDGPAHVAVLVSRSNESGFVQIVTASPSERPSVAMVPSTTIAPPPPSTAVPSPAEGTSGPADADGATTPAPTVLPATVGVSGASADTVARLLADGHAALDDLAFASGSADLDAGNFPSLAALSDWLGKTPDARITLVGHTDAQGNLAANIALSKRRAESVRARLIQMRSTAASQISAEGAGYLAPRASNLTEEGRHKNRRVEVILTPTR